MITFMIKLGKFHLTSLCDKPQLWWLGFLLYDRFLWFQGRLFAHFFSLNPKSPEASKAFLVWFSLCSH